MTNTAFFRNLYTKCKMHGAGEAQVVISDGELYALLSIAADSLDWPHDDLNMERIYSPNEDYYKIPIEWFEEQSTVDVSPSNIIGDELNIEESCQRNLCQIWIK